MPASAGHIRRTPTVKKTRKSIANALRRSVESALTVAAEEGKPSAVPHFAVEILTAAKLIEEGVIDSNDALAFELLYTSPVVMGILTDSDRYANCVHQVREVTR